MKIEDIEIFLVLIIVILQFVSFIQTSNNIVSFKNTILSSLYLKLLKINVPIEDLQTLTLDSLMVNIKKYNHSIPLHNADGDEIFMSKVGTVEINLITYEHHSNKSFNILIKNINSYLLRNYNSSPDFNLIKDMVERHTETIEEEIDSSVSVPLYLGLMGTMLGIVIGLFSMSNLDGLEGFSDENLTSGISILLGGVKIAMIGSFVGLLLTIINSAWFFKEGKILINKKKNDFYSFIQIELLPTLTKDFSSVVDLMQRNLMKFNSDFNSNLQGLRQVFDSSYKTMALQKSLLESIDKTKVSEITKYNVKVLQELNIAVNEFEKFNECFSSINRTIESSFSLTNKLDSILIRTGNFEKIAENLEDKLTKSDALIAFLSQHFADLDNHKSLVRNSVADVSHGIVEVFNELKNVIKSSGQDVKDFTVDEVNILNKLISESHNGLKNLTYLESLNKEVISIKTNSAAQSDKIKNQLDSLNSNLKIALKQLNDLSIPQSGVTPRRKSLGKKIIDIIIPKKNRNENEG